MPDAGRKGGDAATPAAKRAAAKKAASAAETRAAAAREADAAAGGGAAAGAAAGTEEGRGSKATYSSDAASHPFAVEGTDGEEGDLLDDALINEISPAKPAPEGDVLEEAAELGLDQVGKVPLSDSGLVKLAGVEGGANATHDDASQNTTNSHKTSSGDSNADDTITLRVPSDACKSPEGAGQGAHSEPNHDTENKEAHLINSKMRHAASKLMASDFLDNRFYRDAVFRTNSSDEDITTKVFPFDVDEALANGNGQANAGVSHFASHGSVIGRTSSHERIGRLASVFMHAPREKTLKPCLKAVSSYGPGSLKALKKLGSTALDGGAEDGQKRQRVRFFIPKARADGLAGWLTVLSPDSGLVAAWRTFLVLPMAYEMWAGGFRLALGTPQQYWLRSLDVASDLCFVVDGLMSLNTAVRKRDQEGVGGLNRMDSTLIRKRVRIAEIYFKNSFPFLILPSGFYLTVTFILAMEEEAQQQNPNLWLWWISSLPRLVFRVRYLFQYFKAMDMNLNVAVSSMQAVKFFLMIFMSAHWIGSMYFFAARVQPGDAPTWMDGLPQIFPMFEKRTAFLTAKSLSHYILCLYKGVDGLVSIGYFPIVPTNTLEMILAVSVQYLAIWVSAYILGSLFHYLLVSQKDALKEAHTKKMDDLMTFMEERHVPMVTRKRLVEYFEFQYKKAVQRKSSAALKLPRSLEVKVANARFSPTLFKCCNRGLGKERGPFFGCSPQFLNAMVTKLRPVFLMPGDQFMRSSDMVLELCFVSSGYAEVMDGESVKRIIRSDVDTPSIVGEVSFFLGVQQQHSVRAPESSDIELLVLSKEHGEELFRDYPEQQEIINSNILTKFNMDANGNDLEQDAGDEEEDPDAHAMRQILKETVKRRHDEAFQALAWAVTSGDLEEVRRMLRKGVGINASNYDGKTVLHMASVEGNYRVVELLLQEGAEKNKRDRWGNTALQDAINHNQGPVIQLLVQWKSELNNDNAAGRLCDAASAGDLDTLKLILEHGVDPNCGDYDSRTPLHLAAAEGQDKAVQYLIAKGADVNYKDRWGATPLQDAVQSGHLQVAEQILSRGGFMVTELGPAAMCNAATEGDVRYLKLLIRCGVDPDVGDYDFRCPMHLAAAEGRLLAVSYLLGVSANPNAKDRWGGTPMDDCVRGGTQRHLQCAKLLQCLGGRLGTLAKTTVGHEALSTLDTMDMESVRKVIKLLIDQGLDSKKPERATHQECVIAFEASVELMSPVNEISRVFGVVTALLQQEDTQCRQLLDVVTGACKQVAKFAAVVNTAYESKMHPGHNKTSSVAKQPESVAEMLEAQVDEFVRVLHSEEDAEALDRFYDFEMDAATLELYEELDAILAEQERDKFSSRSMRMYLAKDFNRNLMNLYKVEEMWRILQLGFSQDRAHASLRDLCGVDAKGLSDILNFFDMRVPEEVKACIFKEASEMSESGVVTAESLIMYSSTFQNLMLQDDSDDVAQLLYCSPILQALSWQSMQHLCSRVRRVSLRPGQVIRLRERSLVAVQSGSIQVTYRVEAGPESSLPKQSNSPIPQTNTSGEEASYSGAPPPARDVFASMGLSSPSVLRSQSAQHDLHTVTYGRDRVVGEAWAILNVVQVVSITTDENTAIVLLPWTAIAMMLELSPQLFRTLCSNLVDLTYDVVSGEPRQSDDGLLQPFEVRAVHDVYMVTAKKGSKAQRNMAREMQASATRDDFEDAFQKGKDKVRQDRDAAVRSLMDRTRESMCLEWSDSPLKPAILALQMWRMGFKSKLPPKFENEEHENRVYLRRGFEIIEGTWSVVANGANTIYFTHLESLKEHLGEVGVHFFDAAFNPDRTKEELDFRDWVTSWMLYLEGDEHLSDKKGDQPEDEHHAAAEQHQPSRDVKHREGRQAYAADGKSKASQPQDMDGRSWIVLKLVEAYQKLRHTPITPLFGDEEILRAYEPSYVAVTGDVKEVLQRHQVKDFLSLLLIDFDHNLNDMHVSEFMAAFCADGPKGQQLTWFDIERGLRERSNKTQRADRVFLSGFGSALNPNSLPLRTWSTIQQMSALYYFVHVPVRIAFNPYPFMTGWQYALLTVDLVVDSLVFVHLILTFNIGYMNKKSRWVLDRGKIARHYLSSEFWVDLLCATPFDWFGFLSGASQRLSSCFRLPKMLYVYNAFKESRLGLTALRQIGSMWKLIGYITMLLHVASCILFLLGNDGPTDKYTWYRSPLDDDSDLDLQSFNYERKGFGYQLDEDASPVYRVWKQYLLSFYWVTSTVTTTGVISDMYPKNYGEICFTMALLVINLTLFSYVIGQVSANVLKGDEKLLKAREELGAVESYLQSFDFSEDLKVEIKRYFQGATASNFLTASEIFDSVSQSLRLEMSSELTRKCLDNCTLFAGCSVQLKDSIKGLLREVHFGSEEYLFQINTVAHDMLFVMSGKVERLNYDQDGLETVEARIGAGGAVGVLAAYFGIRYMYSARATSLSGPCLCLRLVRNQLMPILKAYPDDEEVVAQNAMSEFQKVKQEKSINGASTAKGRSVKSGARSVASERRIVNEKVVLVVHSENDDEDGASEKSLNTAYELDEGVDHENQNVDAVILSGIEQKLQNLNQRRRAERIAQFCNAASRGEIDKIDRGMRNGVHVDETDVNGRTALHCAASEGQLETVRHLIEARASINILDNYKNTPLNDAVRHKYDNVALELRKNGSMPVVLPGYEMGVQMCTFAFEGDKDQLHRMITNRVDVNIADYDKRTALHLAASQGHLNIVEFLINHQAEVNACDRMGFSPLVDALRHDQLAVQKLLRAHGGQLLGMDVSVELCQAASIGDVSRMKALIDNGANPNAGDYDDRTALHLAASNGETSALDYMLRQLDTDININPIDRLGGTPIEDAHRHGKTVAVAMLEHAGGLRQEDPKLLAMEEKMRHDTEAIQRGERTNKVKDLVEHSPESKACVWVRGRCGKLLPGQLNEIKLLSEDLKEEIDEITDVIRKFLKAAQPQLDESGTNLSRPSMTYEEMLHSHQYKEVVASARNLSDTIRQWRNQTANASAVMAEELPHCRAALIQSKQYRIEVKKLRETFKYVSKTLQYWRFLVLKVPEVRQAEESEERQNRMLGLDREEVDLKEAVSRVAGMMR